MSRLICTDFDEFEEALYGVTGRYVLRSRQQRDWQLRVVELGGVALMFGREGAGTVYSGVGLPGFFNPRVINQGDEPVELKHYINSFRETELKAVHDRHSIEAVVVVGNMSHMCVDGITRAAVDFGYATTVLHDACATLDLEFNGVKVPAEQVHAAFMAALSFGYAPVISTAEYLQRR